MSSTIYDTKMGIIWMAVQSHTAGGQGAGRQSRLARSSRRRTIETQDLGHSARGPVLTMYMGGLCTIVCVWITCEGVCKLRNPLEVCCYPLAARCNLATISLRGSGHTCISRNTRLTEYEPGIRFRWSCFVPCQPL